MSESYPLFPTLSEQGKLEAEAVVMRFKDKFKRAAEEALGEIYVEIPNYIESDSWTNFRNNVLDAFRDYSNRKLQGSYDFKLIRQQIFADFREEILKDLDQDNLERIRTLEADVARLRDMLEHRRSI